MALFTTHISCLWLLFYKLQGRGTNSECHMTSSAIKWRSDWDVHFYLSICKVPPISFDQLDLECDILCTWSPGPLITIMLQDEAAKKIITIYKKVKFENVWPKNKFTELCPIFPFSCVYRESYPPWQQYLHLCLQYRPWSQHSGGHHHWLS